mmetsp:Transcript_15491/g.60576  ORF Transcript_15491/g.60576 Transcript_15491/m.60576 type:complete len:239 (+) Transcript_15491:922-1638(+)
MDLHQSRKEGATEGLLGSAGQRAERLSMESTNGGDEVVPLGGQHGHLEASLHSLRARVDEERVVKLAGRDLGQDVCTVCAERVEQLLRVQCLLPQLRTNSSNHHRVPVSNVVDAEASEAVDVHVSSEAEEAGASSLLAIPPLDGSELVRDALPVVEEARVHIVFPVLHHLPGDVVDIARCHGLLPVDDREHVAELVAKRTLGNSAGVELVAVILTLEYRVVGDVLEHLRSGTCLGVHL